MQFFNPMLNRHFGAGEAFVIAGNQYPANWLAVASATEIAALGFVDVLTTGARGDDRFYDNTEVLSGASITITATQKPIDQIKRELNQAIAASRYDLETGGIVVDGSSINTDRDSQSMLSGALLRVTRSPATVINWKGEDGVWVPLTKDALEAIADAVSAHVQACFTAERAKCEALAALATFDEVVAFDATVTL